MKIRELTQHWEESSRAQSTAHTYSLRLDIESAARIEALCELYPSRTREALLAELVQSALEELEESFPYVEGDNVQSRDEMGDPMYEDVGLTPRFLELSRKHLHRLQQAK
ncbi:pilin assembly protein [Pseudomonas matsuisoli]|jgi:predicted DNA-binding protein|uniref:Pilin assembly protein n=1 Tax=Pseudomonas matsuisoli TaxID=1515666 RepID=A0A917PKL1_9PSED|nr:pilin assembly protein [Pseudomonas matsuisoli]GGJ82083.1 hypothetical protein GCM10009304_05070 [Pseudomonas matsuisoli]